MLNILNKNINITAFLGCVLIIQIGCYNIKNKKSQDYEIDQKYFLGISSPSLFQITVESVFLDNGYSIDSYNNNQTATTVSSKWKVSEYSPQQLDNQILETKTKILVEGKIISNSFSINNGFHYECFLYIKNMGFKNNQYVELYNDSLSFEKVYQIVEEFRRTFDYYN